MTELDRIQFTLAANLIQEVRRYCQAIQNRGNLTEDQSHALDHTEYCLKDALDELVFQVENDKDAK